MPYKVRNIADNYHKQHNEEVQCEPLTSLFILVNYPLESIFSL